MNVLPSPESVFTEAYWAPIPAEREFTHRSTIGKIFEDTFRPSPTSSARVDRATRATAEEALFLAVHQIVAGEQAELIANGEAIGTESDTRNALPGAVILIDTEDLTINERPGKADRKTTMTDASEISMGAIACFLSGMTSTNLKKSESNYPILNGYSERYGNPDIGTYHRSVNAYTFCLGKNGETVGLGMLQWRNEPKDPHATTLLGRLLRDVYEGIPSVVGETANKTIPGVSTPAFSRIREARLCIAGTRSYSRAKAKSSGLHLPSFRPALTN